VRSDALHKITSYLARNFTLIGIENLNVRGMLKNSKLSRAISDVGLFEFRRQLDYKGALYGARVVVADRWFPSSKTCSECGVVKETLGLSERSWSCGCGAHHDRDLNAATNLKFMEFLGDSLWRVKLWFRLEGRNETELCEAGTR
jgi:putative transposase